MTRAGTCLPFPLVDTGIYGPDGRTKVTLNRNSVEVELVHRTENAMKSFTLVLG